MSDYKKINAQHVSHVTGYEVYSIDRYHIGFRDASGEYKIERELGLNIKKNKICEVLYRNSIVNASSGESVEKDVADSMLQKVIDAIKYMDDFDVEII